MNNKLTFLVFLLSKQLLFSPIFIFLFVLAAIVILGSLGLEFVTVGAGLKVFKDFGLSVLNVFSLLLTILAGTLLMSNNKKKQDLDLLLLSKPYSKKDLLLANLMTVIIQILIFSLLIGFLIFLISFIFNQMWFSGIFTAIFFNLLEMILILSFVALFSALCTRRLAIPLLIGVYALGHLLENMIHFTVDSGGDAANYGLIVIQSLLPNLEFFNWRSEIIHHIPIPFGTFIHATFYAVSYSFLILLICLRVYNRRDY